MSLVENKPETVVIPLESSLWRLLCVWMTGTVLIFGYTVTTCVTRGLSDLNVWSSIIGWELPHLLPTLSLILAALGAYAINPSGEVRHVKVIYHRLAITIAAAYLFLVFGTFLLEGMLMTFDLVQTMSIANLWLGPFQAIVSGVLSVLFIRNS